MDTNHYTPLLWVLWNTVGVTNKNRKNAQFVRSRYCLSLALQEKEKDTSPLQFKTHEWMKSLLTVHKQTAGPSEFIDYLKIDLFPDVIYVFTPQGEIIELPRGSTPVDFAYSIHSDIGKKCTGAKINNQNVPLDTS